MLIWVEELVALGLALVHKLALDLLLHLSHHWIDWLILRHHMHHYLLALSALHHHWLLELDFQWTPILGIVHHIQHNIHIVLANASLLNEVLNHEEVKSHLLRLLQEPLL